MPHPVRPPMTGVAPTTQIRRVPQSSRPWTVSEIAAEQSIGIGDNWNDVEMFGCAWHLDRDGETRIPTSRYSRIGDRACWTTGFIARSKAQRTVVGSTAR
ncbi:MAG: hypothetical protein U0P48_06595 [Ancrocorticia sp.]